MGLDAFYVASGAGLVKDLGEKTPPVSSRQLITMPESRAVCAVNHCQLQPWLIRTYGRGPNCKGEENPVASTAAFCGTDCSLLHLATCPLPIGMAR